MTDHSIEAINATIAVFDGWESITVGYYGQRTGEEDDETDWQIDNRAWMDEMEIEDVGQYWVKVKENRVKDEYILKYHSSWQEIHSVWDKAYAELNKMDFYIAVENSLRGRFIEPMKEAMITGNITSAHRILYESIQWINKQNDKC